MQTPATMLLEKVWIFQLPWAHLQYIINEFFTQKFLLNDKFADNSPKGIHTIMLYCIELDPGSEIWHTSVDLALDSSYKVDPTLFYATIEYQNCLDKVQMIYL